MNKNSLGMNDDYGDLSSEGENTNVIRLLYVDDNTISRELVSEMMKSKELIVDTAKNGLDAVKKVLKNIYDVVVMDIEMPQMDGYEASMEIRKVPGFKDLPIIALTAHDKELIEEKVYESGMNGLLQKPIEFENLYTNVFKWAKKPPHNSEIDKTKETANSQKAFETIQGVDVYAGIKRLNGNASLYYKLLFEFFQKNNKSADHVIELVQKHDLEKAAALIHKLKGVAGNLSISSVYSAAVEVENRITACNMGNNDIDNQAPSIINKSVEKLKLILMELGNNLAWKEHLVKESVPRVHEDVYTDPLDLAENLEELLWLLKENNLSAENRFETLKQGLTRGGFKDEVKLAGAFMDNFNYIKAHDILEKVKLKIQNHK